MLLKTSVSRLSHWVGFSVPDLLSLATHANVFHHQQLPQQMQISPYRNTKDHVKNAWQGPIPF